MNEYKDKLKRCDGCEHYKENRVCGYPPYNFCDAMKMSFCGQEPNSWFLGHGCVKAALGGEGE